MLALLYPAASRRQAHHTAKLRRRGMGLAIRRPAEEEWGHHERRARDARRAPQRHRARVRADPGGRPGRRRPRARPRRPGNRPPSAGPELPRLATRTGQPVARPAAARRRASPSISLERPTLWTDGWAVCVLLLVPARERRPQRAVPAPSRPPDQASGQNSVLQHTPVAAV